MILNAYELPWELLFTLEIYRFNYRAIYFTSIFDILDGEPKIERLIIIY